MVHFGPRVTESFHLIIGYSRILKNYNPGYWIYIEDLNTNPAVKKAIILLLPRADIKVLKDALAHLGPYQTLMLARGSEPGG
jgi:hypothetical protein